MKTLIKKVKNKQNGPGAISYAEFERSLLEMKNVPNDEKEGFVLNFFFKKEGRQPNVNHYEDDQLHFAAVFSTKRLLQNALNATIMHVDGTYKLNTENYPLQVFGTTDKNRTFHMIAIAIVSNEDIDTYEFCFRAIKESIL